MVARSRWIRVLPFWPANRRQFQALRAFRLARIIQQEKGYQGHAQRQGNTDGQGDLWCDPGANERLGQRAEHHSERDGRSAHAHHLAAIFVAGGGQVNVLASTSSWG